MVLIARPFLAHNRNAALEQELRLAREEFDAVRMLPVFSTGSHERYRAARDRLNRAREMTLHG